MGLSGAMLALSAVQGIAAISQGFAQSAETRANASLYNQQAGLIQAQGDITQGQYTRQAGQILSTQTAEVAAKGIEPTGSAAAVMLDSQTQIHTDMAIAKFNNTMSINQSNAQAKALNQQAKAQVFSGFSSAFSDLLTGGADYYGYKNKVNLNAGAS